MTDLEKDIRTRAREMAHRHTPRCTGGTKEPRRVLGERYHSRGCDQLTELLINFAKQEIWHREDNQ